MLAPLEDLAKDPKCHTLIAHYGVSFSMTVTVLTESKADQSGMQVPLQ